MLWVALFCVALVLLIFVGTLSLSPPQIDKDLWVKVKLKIDSDVRASWCRVMPGRGLKFYTLDGSVINQESKRVRVVEPCVDSKAQHPIPQDKEPAIDITGLGNIRARSRNPFSRRV